MAKRAVMFSKSDIARIVRLRDVEGRSWKEVGRMMGRKYFYCRQAYEQSKIDAVTLDVSTCMVPTRASSDALAARERLMIAMEMRDFTAAFLGDPPPGYSALDRKRAQA